MSTKTPVINAERRERTGSRFAQRIRKVGKLPAVIYGHGDAPVAISVDQKEVINHIRDGAHILEIKIGGATAETCLVKDLQFGWLGDNVIHIDFARVNLSEEVHVKVHIDWHGEAAAAKRPGAVLNTATELEIVCKVRDIPHELRFDLGAMEDTHLTIGDLTLPEGIRAVNDDDTIVAQITFVTEEAEGEEVEATEGGDEPEVITEAKEDE
ncbi:MAG: 50S ribosomal protein L25 [Phycisphaerales bacterium]|nr:50S ribosomal protein L25 [Phycisphaerales bacterium]